MGKYVAVKGCVVMAQNGIGNYTLGNESNVLKIEGKGAYLDKTTVSVSGYTDSILSGGSGSGVFNATATKMKSEGKSVLVEGDQATVTVMGTMISSGSPGSESITLKIQNAGQTKVKAE